ncbi:hypothetical protein MUA52_05095 [Staphylococcus agnetis]|uniref:hypothetical protein n=1 Tax=Staphylococcus agnetis TaxID=985762 RepID=UPI0021D36117|nr:hypothetical protein [Staphylococcus agnetis]UXU66011.1 hypothetical protein MUA52_09265 [Staphylococcus agnetis]UXU67462.1 hypothetical protein MUA52_05095 [Staphylococcus agnetis]
MKNQEIFEALEEVMYELTHAVRVIDDEEDKSVIDSAINLIESVAFKYEGDE